MARPKQRIVKTKDCLRRRVRRLFRQKSTGTERNSGQLDLFCDLPRMNAIDEVVGPKANIVEFLNFICDALPNGELYLFGGVLRDLAWYGSEGFDSDIDLVADVDQDDWENLIEYVGAGSSGIKKNRFGGFRLRIDNWPIDVWRAKDTWAIQRGLVEYRGIGSLTRTTILNWDAILLNWRTRSIVCAPDYFEQLRVGLLDVVLEQNPNPIGAVVRAYRYLCMNDAQTVTASAARYFKAAAREYSCEIITSAEMSRYGNSTIDPAVLEFFRLLDTSSNEAIRRQFRGVSQIVQAQLV